MGRVLLAAWVTAWGIPMAAQARPVTVRLVADDSGQTANVAGFRYLVEKDTTHQIEPGVPSARIPSLDVHGSHAPVVASGAAIGPEEEIDVPDEPLVITVLPDGPSHGLGGAVIPVGADVVDVVVRPLPAPTAQIRVYAFRDHQPINGAPDLPVEAPLEGFSVLVFDAAGQVGQDAFGQPLGTTYVEDGAGNFLLDAEGQPIVDQLGDGTLLTGPDGELLVRFLPPGKYGVQVVPPAGQGWVQTSTIEGTHTNDAWVRAGEPPFFAEWGALEWHVFFGFTQPSSPTGGSATVQGKAVYVHEAPPPQQAGLFPGRPVDGCWVGLNALDQADQQVYAGPCGPEGTFSIGGVPPGNYQLVVWDLALDAIIDFRTFTVAPDDGLVDLGEVAVFAWFGTLEGSVFYDADKDGFRDPGEQGLPGQDVIIRFPDGSIRQATTTDPSGDYGFDEVFPWFHWMVMEVGFTLHEATGATFVNDLGGELPTVGSGVLGYPQRPPANWDTPRTVAGEPVLTQGMLLYAGQTQHVDWGKAAYVGDGNGGISGIVHYATTRAENDPRFAVAEDWEPGIPRVPVALYLDADADGVADDLDADGFEPLQWDFATGTVADFGDAVAWTLTDSWDDARPTGCNSTQVYYDMLASDCAETLRTWNQLRPAVFDGGYAFATYVPEGLALVDDPAAHEVALPPGDYVVEVKVPPGYELVKEEDKNVDYGEDLVPALPPPPCVGDVRPVPETLSLFPDIAAPFAGEPRPLCDRKAVRLEPAQNAAADFFLFTPVPKSGRIWGIVLNDMLLAFDPNSPQLGSNAAPSWLPISIRDWSGQEIQRTYTDRFGRYEALVPSTFSVDRPMPTGVSPNILQVCLNDPYLPDGTFDQAYDPRYARICTSWDFWPGKTTRLDTPILPLAAFAAGPERLDCGPQAGSPVIESVGPPNDIKRGPVVPKAGGQLEITAVLDAPDGRDHGFGTSEGQVTLAGTPLPVTSWGDGAVEVTVPDGAETGQLLLTRADGAATEVGVTVHVDPKNVVYLPDGASIQDAIDAVKGNQQVLIVVPPGTYRENLFLYKNVQLQGTGAGSTFLVAGPLDNAAATAWDAKLQALIDGNEIALVGTERPDFYLEQAPGVLVATGNGGFPGQAKPRVDGFTILGAVKGGGIYLHAHAAGTTVSNNVLTNNQGSFGGGLRVGTPTLLNNQGDGFAGSDNAGVRIHHNRIVFNGAFDGGGGVSLFKGSDGYRFEDNLVCGNYSNLYGGGLAHYGFSPGGVIANNRIVANQSFDEGGGLFLAGELPPAGAGAGALTEGAGSVQVLGNLVKFNMAGDDGGGLRTLMFNGQDVASAPRRPDRWASLWVEDNVFVNNVSADAGGGIALDDTAQATIVQNTVAHNDSTATGIDAFGGPCGPNCPETRGGGLVTSNPQVAGLAARVHSAGLQAAFGRGFEQTFSNPTLAANLFWHNYAHHWDANAADLVFDDVWDLGVYGGTGGQMLEPYACVLTPPADYGPDNWTNDPEFVSAHDNAFSATSKGAAFGNFVSILYEPATFQSIWTVDYTIDASPYPAVGPADAPAFGVIP